MNDALRATHRHLIKAQDSLHETGDYDNYRLDEAMALIRDAANIIEGEWRKQFSGDKS